MEVVVVLIGLLIANIFGFCMGQLYILGCLSDVVSEKVLKKVWNVRYRNRRIKK